MILNSENVYLGDKDIPIYCVKVELNEGFGKLKQIRFTPIGSFNTNDISKFKLQISNSNYFYPNNNNEFPVLNSIGAGEQLIFDLPNSFLLTNQYGNNSYYVWIVADIGNFGMDNHNILVNGTSNPATLVYENNPVVIDNQSNLAGMKTIKVSSLTQSSTPTIISNFHNDSQYNIFSKFKVYNKIGHPKIKKIRFKTGGSYSITDVTGFDLSYSSGYDNTTGYSNFTKASVTSGTIVEFDNSQQYNNYNFLQGSDTTFFYLRVNVSKNAQNNKTIYADVQNYPIEIEYETTINVANLMSNTNEIKTIIAPTSINISTMPLNSDSIIIGTDKNIIYAFKIEGDQGNIIIDTINAILSSSITPGRINLYNLYSSDTYDINSANNIGYFDNYYSSNNNKLKFNLYSRSFPISSPQYFWITANINQNAVSGETIFINGNTNPVEVVLNNSNSIVNNQTNIGGIHTIYSPTYEISTLPISAKIITIGSTLNPIYGIKN